MDVANCYQDKWLVLNPAIKKFPKYQSVPSCMYKIFLFFCFCLFSAYAISQTASFTYSSTTGSICNPATIQFTQNSTGTPVGYIWNFGNGAKSHSANPLIVYNKAGTFNVSLTVIYAGGIAKVSNSIVINQTPNPSFTYDKSTLCQPGTINFSALSNFPCHFECKKCVWL